MKDDQEVTGLMTVLSLRVILWAGVFLLLVPACGHDNVDNADKNVSNQAGDNSQGERAGQDIVAMIGDEPITRAALEAALDKIPQRRRSQYRYRVLDRLIKAKVYSDEARKAGLDKEPQIKKDLERATNEILARSFVKKYVDQQAEPSQEEIGAYYQEHKDQFVVPEGVLIQHILVKRKQDAESVLKALKEGASFEDVAEDKSIAHSWKEGGKLGWLYKGYMDPEMEKVAFDLGKEKLSDIIKTGKGYEIIKVLDRSDERKMDFEEAQTKIRLRLVQERKRELIDAYYQEARVNTKPAEQGVLVKVGDEALTQEALSPILAKGSEKEKEKLRRRWVRYFVETTVFSEEARKVGLENDPEVADALKRKSDNILADAFQKRFIMDNLHISDKDIADSYQSHLEQFRVPVRLRAKSILVKTRQEAEKILEELGDGTYFAYVAQKKSLHPEAERRAGEIGWFGKGEKDPVIEKAAFALEKGEMSGILKTQAGYEIIKLMDKRGGDIRPLEEVEQEIKITLIQQRLEQEKQGYYKKADVKILEAAGAKPPVRGQ